jgi:hypothetical protein
MELWSFPDFKKPFKIQTDASDFQLGAVIMQECRPVALNAAQWNYTTGKREMLSILETLRAYRNILLGHERNYYIHGASESCE